MIESAPLVATPFRIGVDENGLGSRLGPLVVTAVLARTDGDGERALSRRLPRSLRSSLDDSKRLVSHADVRLGEAWARELVMPEATTPGELFERLSLEGVTALKKPCPEHASAQCWNAEREAFEAPAVLLRRVARQDRKSVV